MGRNGLNIEGANDLWPSGRIRWVWAFFFSFHDADFFVFCRACFSTWESTFRHNCNCEFTKTSDKDMSDEFNTQPTLFARCSQAASEFGYIKRKLRESGKIQPRKEKKNPDEVNNCSSFKKLAAFLWVGVLTNQLKSRYSVCAWTSSILDFITILSKTTLTSITSHPLKKFQDTTKWCFVGPKN